MAWHTQNFLQLRKHALGERLLDLASVGPRDLVLDLGAGHGELTERLAQRARRVIAVEHDPRLAAALRQRFAGCPNVVIQEADILQVRLPRQPYTVVANIPFDGTARLLSRLTGARHAPEASHIVVQRAAAARILGWPRQTLFAVLRHPWFEPRVVHQFRRTDFAPSPRVDVVFLRLRKRGPPLVAESDAAFYRAFVTFCFLAPTRTVRETLAALVGQQRSARLARAMRLAPEAPPSAVPFEVWLGLFQALADDAAVRRRVQGARRPAWRLP